MGLQPLRASKNSAAHVQATISRLATVAPRREYAMSQNHDLQATNHVINGNSLIVGIGEVMIDVYFPVAFIRAPSMSFGAELSAESVAVTGKFPTVSAIVNQWLVEDPDYDLYGGSMRKYYKGATLACVVTGPGTQKMLLHWTFMGMALTNPGGGTFEVPSLSSSGRVIS